MDTQANRSETLLFAHIPKTAGTTLSSIIVPQYDAKRIFHVRNPQHRTAPRYSPHAGTVKDLAALTSEERAQFDCVLGHFDFGIHELIPRAYRYVTVLRDPVARVLSNHRQHVHHFTANGAFRLEDPPSLAEFLELSPNTWRNLQTRALVGLMRGRLDADESVFSEALENLRVYRPVLGILERFDESLVVMARVFGWRDISYEALNRTSQYRLDQPPDVVERIHRANAFDRRLYAEVDAMLDRAIVDYGQDFDRDLADLRRRNELAQAPVAASVRNSKRAAGRIRSLVGRLVGR